MTIQPIETKYGGYRFRSRLEARWAVFFDHLHVKWQYERQGYQVDDVRYLPDFWLPGMEVHVEVKGVMDEPSANKIAMISGGLIPDTPPTLVLGDIPKLGEPGPHFIGVGSSYKAGTMEIHNLSFIRRRKGDTWVVPFGWPKLIDNNPYVYNVEHWRTCKLRLLVTQPSIEAAYTAGPVSPL